MSKRRPKKRNVVTKDYTKPNKEEVDALQDIANSFQSGIEKVRGGREKIGYKLVDIYNEWFTSLMMVSITIASAMIALSTLSGFSDRIRQPFFWPGVMLLMLNGLYVLLYRKRAFEKESLKAATMSYETEYYLMKLRNGTKDVILGKQFKLEEYKNYKDKLLTKTMKDIDDSYSDSKTIDERMDVTILVLISGLMLILLSTIKDQQWLLIASASSLFILIVIMLVFHYRNPAIINAINERDEWLTKIKTERKRI